MLSPGADVTRVVMDTGEEAAPSASTSAPGGRGMEDGGGPGEGPGAGKGKAGAAASPGECGCQREREERALNKGTEAEALNSHSGVRWEGSSS